VINQKELTELNEVDQKLSLIKEKKYTQNENIRLLVEKRDKCNLKFKELRQNINEQKMDRDELNEKVKKLKQKRDIIRLEISSKIEEIMKHRQKIDSFRDKLPIRKNIDLQKEFEDLEWKIQTTTLELDEEKQLVEQVKIIGTQLNKYKKIDKQKKIIFEIQSEINELKKITEKTHEELTKIANQSQKMHKAMSLNIDELNNIKEKGDQFHFAYLKEKKEQILLQDEIRKLIDNKNKLRKIIKEQDETRKREAEKKIKKEIKSEAQNKLKNGKKLSLEEFKLLSESEDKTIKNEE